MFIHIGNKETVSDKTTIGIFSIKTLNCSSLNKKYMDRIEKTQRDIKTIVIDNKNGVLWSKVSSFTIIKRTTLDDKDFVWSRK
jgi:gluconate kinase